MCVKFVIFIVNVIVKEVISPFSSSDLVSMLCNLEIEKFEKVFFLIFKKILKKW